MKSYLRNSAAVRTLRSAQAGLAFCALALLALAEPAPAAPVTANDLFSPAVAQRLGADISAAEKQHNLPSVAVEVSIPGRGSYTFVDGYANLKTRLRRTLAQPFRIASITKPFAATAILVLVDRGLLRKTDPISKWYPNFPNAGKITIDDLLRMRSGIPAPDDDAVLAKVYDAPLAAAPSLAQELAGLAKLRAEFKPPNTVGVYTDFNYDILAGIVERVTGKDIGQLIAETVIQPLHLSETSYPTGTSIPGPLRGYGWNPKTKQFDDKTLFNPPLAGAAGAVVSDMSDLDKFSRVLCKGGLLKPQTQRERLIGQLLAGSSTRYGEGVAVGDGVCGHSGTINGFNTDMYYVAKTDLSFVISVNRLDRDNKGQTTPILALVFKAVSGLSPARAATGPSLAPGTYAQVAPGTKRVVPNGSQIVITRGSGGGLDFTVEAVRLSNHNSGTIAGHIPATLPATWINKAEFAKCSLTFSNAPLGLKVTQDYAFGDCGFGYGVVADGTYVRAATTKP